MVTPHSSLMMHIIIRLKDGSIAENTRRIARPVKVILGDGSISEKFEQALIGMKVGEKKEFFLAASDAFGESLAGNIMKFPRAQFGPEVEVEKGMIIEFQNMQGAELLGVVKSMEEDQVTVDFNHPLAGQDLQFEIELLEIL